MFRNMAQLPSPNERETTGEANSPVVSSRLGQYGVLDRPLPRRPADPAV
ncbi:MAG: hypothetical protein WKF80_04280 [Thermomicrobiales bacterium]